MSGKTVFKTNDSSYKWMDAQVAERKHHNLSFGEGVKHYSKSYEQYFKYLGIDKDLKCKKVAEVGPADFPALMICDNIGQSFIVEPMTSEILESFNIPVVQSFAEETDFSDCDEVWLLNVLQHVQDPYKIVENAKKAKVVRFFEPVNYGVDECHLWNLTMEMFKEWFGEVNYYPKQKAECFHEWECAYGVWSRLSN
jgi:hypothetical protein